MSGFPTLRGQAVRADASIQSDATTGGNSAYGVLAGLPPVATATGPAPPENSASTAPVVAQTTSALAPDTAVAAQAPTALQAPEAPMQAAAMQAAAPPAQAPSGPTPTIVALTQAAAASAPLSQAPLNLVSAAAAPTTVPPAALAAAALAAPAHVPVAPAHESAPVAALTLAGAGTSHPAVSPLDGDVDAARPAARPTDADLSAVPATALGGPAPQLQFDLPGEFDSSAWLRFGAQLKRWSDDAAASEGDVQLLAMDPNLQSGFDQLSVWKGRCPSMTRE